MFKLKLNIALIIGMFVFNACTDVDICSESDHIHLTELNIAYDLSEVDKKPDSMIILATRVVDSWKCGYRQSIADGKGQYLFNNPNTSGEDILRVKRGQYRIFAVNYNENSEVYNYSGIKENIGNPKGGLTGISIQYKNTKPNTAGTCFKDYNSSMGFAPEKSEKVYVFASGIVTAENKTANIDIVPTDIEHEFELDFNINTENVTIDEICGQVSGLYSGYNLTLQEPTTGVVKKMLTFENKGNGKYTAKTKAVGIVANKQRTAKTGSGIVQLSIKYKAGNESRIEHVGLNMYNTINRHGRDIQGKDIKLNIDEPLTINRNGLVKSNNTNILIDSWFQYTSN